MVATSDRSPPKVDSYGDLNPAMVMGRKQSDTHVLGLSEDVLVRILTTSTLSVADVLSFGAGGKPCLEFVQRSSQLWLELLRRDFPEQDVSETCRENAQILQRLFIKRWVNHLD